MVCMYVCMQMCVSFNVSSHQNRFWGAIAAIGSRKKQCFVHISDKSASVILEWSSTILTITIHNSCVYEPYVRMSRWVYAGSKYEEVKLQCVDSRAFDRLWVENQPNPSISCICYLWVFIVSPWFSPFFMAKKWGASRPKALLPAEIMKHHPALLQLRQQKVVPSGRSMAIFTPKIGGK